MPNRTRAFQKNLPACAAWLNRHNASVNVDAILDELNRHEVDYLVIGGMSFLLRHQPILTFDVDFWICPEPENQRRCERALASLQAEWGRSEQDWGPVAGKPSGWLAGQSVFCLNSPQGAIDIFLSVPGLESWPQTKQRAITSTTGSGIRYHAISDDDMLRCQLALPPEQRKMDRIAYLQKKVRP